jgi:hypothetical protein
VERERTGIKSLKVGYNKVFGYYIEVTRSNSDIVPSDYIRKQTLVNAERYITSEMKEIEVKLLNAEEEIHDIELRLYKELLRQIAAFSEALIRTAQGIARLDVCTALADVASRNGYVRRHARNPRRAAPGCGTDTQNRALYAQRCHLRQWEVRSHHHRAKYVGQEHLSAPGSVDRTAGTDWLLRARR